MPFRKVVAGSARQFQYTCSFDDISSLHCYIENQASAGFLVASGVATASGDGLYYCNLGVGSDVGSYTAYWIALYGTLADSSVGTWISSQEFEVVLRGEQ
jgi:hypothetical protein